MRVVRWSTRCALRWFLAIVFVTLCHPKQTAQQQKPGTAHYSIAFSLPLSQKDNGVNGFLQLRQDARLTKKLSGLLWDTGGDSIDDDPALAVFKNDPPRNAILQVVDRAGKVLHSKVVERPLAKLRTEHLYGDSRLTYLLTVDYSAGFGSYSGPITNLIEVPDGRIEWVQSTEVKSGHKEKISLMQSLKTTWEFAAAPGGHGKQILLAQCRPDWSSVKDDPDFRTTYARFFFNGANWMVLRRTVKGLSEFEQGFPSRKHFP